MNVSRLLFVCSGNTCRSPMAEVIARDLASKHGLEFEFRSAGLMATEAAPAAEPARIVASTHGLDLTGHSSKQLTPGDLDWADLVFGMTYGHVDAVRRQAPGVPSLPITGFLPHDNPGAGVGVDDPYGGSIDDYEQVWSTLEEALEAMLKRLGNLESDD